MAKPKVEVKSKFVEKFTQPEPPVVVPPVVPAVPPEAPELVARRKLKMGLK